jgi:predicted ribosomally synthesized peptide with nif11-like leader
MSLQSAKDFLRSLETDKTLQDRLQAAPDLEARRRIVQAAGFDFSLDEFNQAVDELAQASSRELTPEDLEQIAGGTARAGWGCAHDWPQQGCGGANWQHYYAGAWLWARGVMKLEPLCQTPGLLRFKLSLDLEVSVLKSLPSQTQLSLI